jgi:hypothetical protein
MFCDFGVPTDPGRLNRWLRDHNGYADGCLFRFYAVAGLGADLQSLTGAPPRDHITAALADHAAVLAELTPYDDHHRRHWIRITAPFPADWTIMDPWQLPGAELTTLSAAWPCATITRAAVYKPNPARVIPLALTAAGPVQSTPSICATPDGVGRWDPNPGGN